MLALLASVASTDEVMQHFEIQTLRDRHADRVEFVYPPHSAGFEGEYYERVGDSIRMTAPVHGAKTSATAGGPRTELRELYGSDASTGALPLETASRCLGDAQLLLFALVTHSCFSLPWQVMRGVLGGVSIRSA